MRAAQGKLFSLEGCGHEAQGAAVPSPGFTTSQGRTGRPLPNGDVANSASPRDGRSEEHTSELQSLMRISYAVFCLKKKKTNKYTPLHATKKSTELYIN